MSLEKKELNSKQKNTTSIYHLDDQIFEEFQDKSFQEQIQYFQGKVDFYENLEQQVEQKRKSIFDAYKRKEISGEEYTNQVKALFPYEITQNPIYRLKKQIRELQVQSDINWVKQEQILTNINQLGENISDGGMNNKGVFLLWKDYIARKSARGYDDASRLILYKDRIQSAVIKKTLQVTKLDGYVYQVQQRAYGQSLTKLTTQEKNIIPQQHLEQFWNAIDEMRELWISLDISWGKSNVFYDQKYGFSIIDLGIWWFSDNSTIQQTLFEK